MDQTVYGKGFIGLLKRGWHEIPGVMGASVIGIVGLGLCLYSYQLSRTGPAVSKYKNDYIVVRPDDPRANQPARTFPLGNYFQK